MSELRSSGPPLLAAGALIAGLLARPVFHCGHPHGFLEISAAAWIGNEWSATSS